MYIYIYIYIYAHTFVYIIHKEVNKVRAYDDRVWALSVRNSQVSTLPPCRRMPLLLHRLTRCCPAAKSNNKNNQAVNTANSQ